MTLFLHWLSADHGTANHSSLSLVASSLPKLVLCFGHKEIKLVRDL